MSKYFTYFPRVKHTGEFLVDITKRVDVFSDIAENPNFFVPYTVEGDLRPEEVAHYYYGSTEYVWIVYLTNNIIDPYSDWPKTTRVFEEYLEKKYEEQSGLVGGAVVEWTQNETITDNILYYYNTSSEDIVSVDTYTYGSDLIEGFVQGDWAPMRIYESEFIENEAKRKIYLVDNTYTDFMDKELKRLINE